jgi:hypothetical protein
VRKKIGRRWRRRSVKRGTDSRAQAFKPRGDHREALAVPQSYGPKPCYLVCAVEMECGGKPRRHVSAAGPHSSQVPCPYVSHVDACGKGPGG